MKSYHSLRIQLIFLLCSYMFLGGCAEYKTIGIRKVDHSPERIGVVEEAFVKYFPIKVQHFPTDENPELRIYLIKEIKEKIEYHKKSHDETIYQRERGPIEKEAERISKNFEINPISGLMELAISPLMVLMDYHPFSKRTYKDVRYEKIAGSDSMTTYYEYQSENRPADNTYIILEKIGETMTTENGIATFQVSPSLFDVGLKLFNKDSGETYFIRRERRSREYKADWYPEAKIGSDIYSIGATIYKVRRAIILGSGPYAIAGAIIVETISGAIIGFIIDVLGTKTEEYYQWSLVRLPIGQ